MVAFVKFQNIKNSRNKDNGKQVFENLFFSDFNTGQVSNLNTVQ